MVNKTIYWIPVVGLFVSLWNYEKENGMNTFWSYYQTVCIIALITLIAYSAIK